MLQAKSLYKFVMKWQPRLGLRDWSFDLSTVEPRYMIRPEGMLYGEIQMWHAERKAKIRVTDTDDIPDDELPPTSHSTNRDYEYIVLHEMLHILIDTPFIMCDIDKYQGSCEVLREQSINQLAIALLTMDRNPAWADRNKAKVRSSSKLDPIKQKKRNAK